MPPGGTICTEFDFIMDPNGFAEFVDKILLVVNMTHTDPYIEVVCRDLTKLNLKYKNDGLRILCFPCSQFGARTSKKDIQDYVEKNGFDIGTIFDEVDVNGKFASRFYQFLKSKKVSRRGSVILENFTYFIIDKRGKVCERFSAKNSYYTLEDLIYQLI